LRFTGSVRLERFANIELVEDVSDPGIWEMMLRRSGHFGRSAQNRHRRLSPKSKAQAINQKVSNSYYRSRHMDIKIDDLIQR